ncbi:TetR/AcrR family transcriptional regulator [Nocardiopsis changdeensis]|uniref:TetR/AcrR family transcriptional regulator n=1 Tax=Nocardiopsis changdeensis TaxID=2831969 RepID=A0ABX8BK67_9ACTN|nr:MULTISPECIES: TetR/AcrR family transcriptional regulator [Nocardiopsis]QUX21321.1 TetR/AcrR family transcriptional regulator [Nocardiopsis changdeensis]QYX37252.1 TetR/AcrR family transcriptional regulator [Nocardiopsis sp. MT53]
MSVTEAGRSTAEARRAAILRHAVPVFARSGYHATPVTEIADAAGISQAYVFRLFGSKLGLFTATLDRCFGLIEQALREGAEKAPGAPASQVLAAMGDSYAELIADRDLLMLQVHAQSAADVPEVRECMRRGYASAVTLVHELSGGTREQVRYFMAMGLMCHLITALDLDGVDEPWALTLTSGMTVHGRRADG